MNEPNRPANPEPNARPPGNWLRVLPSRAGPEPSTNSPSATPNDSPKPTKPNHLHKQLDKLGPAEPATPGSRSISHRHVVVRPPPHWHGPASPTDAAPDPHPGGHHARSCHQLRSPGVQPRPRYGCGAGPDPGIQHIRIHSGQDPTDRGLERHRLSWLQPQQLPLFGPQIHDVFPDRQQATTACQDRCRCQGEDHPQPIAPAPPPPGVRDISEDLHQRLAFQSRDTR